jgi:hypothetical protein
LLTIVSPAIIVHNSDANTGFINAMVRINSSFFI